MIVKKRGRGRLVLIIDGWFAHGAHSSVFNLDVWGKRMGVDQRTSRE